MQPTSTTFQFGNFSGMFPSGMDDMHWLASFTFISIFVVVILHIAFAFGAYVDGRCMFEHKRGPFLVGPLIWALAVLAGGIPIVAVYWAIHHSTLRSPAASETDPLE